MKKGQWPAGVRRGGGREVTMAAQGRREVPVMQLHVLMILCLSHQHYQLSDLFIYPHMCVCIHIYRSMSMYVFASPTDVYPLQE